MNRKLFFWLEKLKITPAERKAVSVLMILLVLLTTLNMTITPSVPFGDDYYNNLEKQFEARTAMLREKENKLMKHYFPPLKEKEITTVSIDTVTVDSSRKAAAEKNDQQADNGLIDINKADQQTLESLPGIGPTYAKRIINYREKKGGFKSFKELIKIKGIGKKRLENLKPFIKLRDSE